MAGELGIADHCIFYGQCNREKVYSVMSQMDFCISTSLFECSGVSVEEAMLLGRPMLVTRSGGANSLCTDDTAIIVDSGSATAIRDGIRQMISRLNSFSPDSIREYAFENFEITNTSKKYYELFQSILGE